MGIIKRQGLVSSLFMYFGVVLGFINGTLLFPKILGPSIYGFTQTLAFTVGLFAVFSMLGLQNTTVRYFAYFRGSARMENGFFSFLLALTLAMTTVVGGSIFLLKPLILGAIQDPVSRDLAREYYYLLFFYLVASNLFSVLNGYTVALGRPRVGVFLTQVGTRLLTTLLILAYYFDWIDLKLFLDLFGIKNLVNVLVLVVYLEYLGVLRYGPLRDILRHPELRPMLYFSLFAMFSLISNELIGHIDTLMVSSLLSFSDAGIYTVYYYFAQIIQMPFLAIGLSISAIIADAWKRQDLKKIQETYQQTTVVMYILGVVAFVGIIVNLDNAVAILGPEYARGTPVAVLLGLGQLINVINGHNQMIIIHSPRYRFDLLGKLVTTLLTIATNFYFIRYLGMVGAALATALTYLLINALYQGFVYRHWRLFPFSKALIWATLAGVLALIPALILPRFANPFVDAAVRSLLVLGIYGGAVLALRVSPDANQLAGQIYQRITRFLGK